MIEQTFSTKATWGTVFEIFHAEPTPEEALAGAPGQPVQGDQYIHVKVSDSGGMDRIRTRRFGKGILARIGFKNGRSHVVSLLFDKNRWSAEEARDWWKSHRESLGSTDELAFGSIYVEPEFVDLPVETFGFEIPEPTPTKAWVVFKLLSFFPVINQRKDSFREEDVSDAALASLVGSPIFGNDDLTDHFNRTGTRGPQIGAVVDVRKRQEDGIYALAAFYKEILAEHYGVDAKELPQRFSVSMETRFDPDTVCYKVDNQTLDRSDAVAKGIGALFAGDDNPQKYDARLLTPIEYHAVALLRRGRNADPTADVLLAAASKEHIMPDEIQWHEEDFQSLVQFAESFGAELSSERRKALQKSQFAYVDEDGVGHLPIHDVAHVRNALARLNQTKISGEAKRKAFRKILAAARRFGIEIDKDSAIYKAYAAMHSEEEHRQMWKAMRNNKNRKKNTAMASNDFEVIADTGDSVLFVEDGTLSRASLAFDDDGDLSVKEIEELARLFSIEETTMSEENHLDEAAWKAREEALKAELETAFKSREPEIAKAAIEVFKTSSEFKALLDAIKAETLQEYQKTLETVAARLKDLESIHPFKDDAERQTVESKIAETVNNDVEWLQLKTERYQLALASVVRPKPIKTSVPTLVARAAAPSRDPFDFTEEG